MGEAETIKIVNAFIQRWQGQEGGQERANYALFLTELCDLIGVEHPEPAGATHERNDYVFERVVTRVCTENLNPNVLTMKCAQYGARIYDAGSLNLARDRRILVQ
jgi:hypothetical protein